MSWLPIESAPKDGSDILGWREDCGILLIRWTAPIDLYTDTEIERMVADCIDSDWVEEYGWIYADVIQGGRLDGSETPTHWMPLPEPPK